MGDFTGEPQGLVTLKDIEAAASRIAGLATRTPLLPVPDLSQDLGGEVRLKCESLQRTGSFKVRGAFNFLSQIPRKALERGVVTFSSGNHGQAMTLAAREKGVRSVVVMPTTAARVKVEGARRLGAEVVFAGTTSQHRMERAEALVEEEGLTMVPPFEHPHIIAGQGTVGLEIMQDWPEVEVVLVPIGGGGLSSGVAVALKSLQPEIQVLGVEPAGAPGMRAALDAGEPVTLASVNTLADGLKTVRVGDLTFRHVSRFLDDVVLVADDAIEKAVAYLFGRGKLVVEYSGAATVAALLSETVPLRGRRVAAVLSGGNLDPEVLQGLVGGGT